MIGILDNAACVVALIDRLVDRSPRFSPSQATAIGSRKARSAPLKALHDERRLRDPPLS